MADLVITPADVLKGVTNPQTVESVAGEAIVAGKTLYRKASDGFLYLADNDVDGATATVVGISVDDAAVGQPIIYQRAGEITVSAVLTVGETYVLSATPGGIAPVADLIASNFVTHIGIALSTTSLRIGLVVSGVQQ